MWNKNKTFFGVAYYPEAWERSEIGKDLNKIADFGFNCVRIGEFAWGSIEPCEGEYDFSVLREVVNECKKLGISVIMCTPTATPPRWMIKKHPEIMGVDSRGVRMGAGARRMTCDASEVYLQYTKTIVEKLAKEFCDEENIIGWQIDNEISAVRFDGLNCCCEHCVARFRRSLSARFKGDIEKLNRAWGTYVWSQGYSSFDEIDPPVKSAWNNPVLLSEWKAFQDASEREFVTVQYEILKKYVSVPVGHNGFMHLCFDYGQLVRGLDIAMLDEYVMGDQLREASFWLDYYRTMKKEPFWLMETSPCWNGDSCANYMRPYGFNKANVWLAYLSGAELVNYWLWRSHYGGQELMHGAVLSSEGRPFHIAGEVKELARELEIARETLEETDLESPKIALHVSSKSAQTVGSQRIVPELDYYAVVKNEIYTPIERARYKTDLISPYADTEGYKVIVSPFLFYLNEGGLVEKMLAWVEKGGIWIVGPASDIRSECGAKYTDRAKGYTESVTDTRVEFYLPKGETYAVRFDDGEEGNSVSCYYEAMTVGKNTRSVADYADGEYVKGYSAVTETAYGKGKIVALGFLPDGKTWEKIIERYAGQVCVERYPEAGETTVTFFRKGENSKYYTAVETGNKTSWLVTPFACEDILSGKKYQDGEKVALAPFEVLLLKEV